MDWLLCTFHATVLSIPVCFCVSFDKVRTPYGPPELETETCARSTDPACTVHAIYQTNMTIWFIYYHSTDCTVNSKTAPIYAPSGRTMQSRYVTSSWHPLTPNKRDRAFLNQGRNLTKFSPQGDPTPQAICHSNSKEVWLAMKGIVEIGVTSSAFEYTTKASPILFEFHWFFHYFWLTIELLDWVAPRICC